MVMFKQVLDAEKSTSGSTTKPRPVGAALRIGRRGLIAAVSVGVVLLTAPLPAGAATKNHRHRLCSSIVSAGAIASATGLANTRLTPAKDFGPNPYNLTKSNDAFWDFWTSRLDGKANLPGSICTYDDPDPNTSYTQLEFDDNAVPNDFVVVGYGESHKYWDKFTREFAKNGGDSPGTDLDIPTSGIHGNAPETHVSLGHGSQAILNTANLVAAGDADPTDYPQFPSSFYILTVMTKHHNVLQIGMYGASLGATEALVSKVLGTAF